MKNKFVFLVSLVLFSTILFPYSLFALNPVKTGSSLSDSAAQANRRTALRCLSIAKEYATNKEWASVVSQAELGLAYDESIADLWYVDAIGKNALGATRATVLPLVTKALTEGQWVDYNRDSARILFADILCDTGRFSEVPGILDAQPVLFSADAEYIRTKAYYRLHDAASIQTARDKIDTARKIYPEDTRFPLLFFKSESPAEENPQVRKIADSFISRISLYADAAPDKDAELEMYASLFARGEQQIRMLKSFAARGLQHPLFAAAALRSGLYDEQKAFDYFVSFADGSISYKMLEDFVPLITNDAVREKANTYFTAYGGVILFDSDGDGIDNMYVKYNRGRPETVVFDRNQDGIIDWKISCDFGEPVNGEVTSHNLYISWNPYPYLNHVEFRGTDDKSVLTFNLVQERMNWTPFDMVSDTVVEDATGVTFFFPVLKKNMDDINDESLIAAASSYEIPSKERPGAKINFTILDGQAQLARYSVNGTMYAQAQFENGVPTMRTVDADGDGVFETTEFYGFDKDGTMEVHSMEEERAVMTNLFGLPADGAGFYLKLIQVDRDGDTVPDFTEEYLPHGGKITSWDTDRDGLWDIRYVKYPPADTVIEDALFYETTQHDLVTVTSIDGIPSKVKTNAEELSVTKDPKYRFYWIGEMGRSEFAKKALVALNQSSSQGVCTTVAEGEVNMLCVRIGNYYFGKILHHEGGEAQNAGDKSESK